MPETTGSVRNLTAPEAKALLGSTPPDGLVVLDVRQPAEYAEIHLPGARLVPLGELPDRLAEIPRDLPVLTYCRSGRRSLAAASLLAGQGYPDVRNLLGGMEAWNGQAASGPPEAGLDLFAGRDSLEDLMALAYALEGNLAAFYRDQAAKTPNQELAGLFLRLAGFEDRHTRMICHMFTRLAGLHQDASTPERSGPQFPSVGQRSRAAAALADKARELGAGRMLEGGRTAGDILAERTGGPADARDVLDMAMSIEAQALDLYMRQAPRTADPSARPALEALAREEAGHIKSLAALLERLAREEAGPPAQEGD